MRALAAAAVCASFAVVPAAQAGSPVNLDHPARMRWPRMLELRDAELRPAWLPAPGEAGQAGGGEQPAAQETAPQKPPSEPPPGSAAAPEQDFDLL